MANKKAIKLEMYVTFSTIIKKKRFSLKKRILFRVSQVEGLYMIIKNANQKSHFITENGF